ncbi:hypothetical protein SCHPADRAFT_735078 [Schizopora paradoxa]|uniref:Uncharacterized protein n=1 Tax=Schizopora paradoxa TaxID=27342 RepID=A0A0H2R1E6_9AGAM|nr:hypothetical protein SCHPADRAFT_735078 [Schizopora paradoxa]
MPLLIGRGRANVDVDANEKDGSRMRAASPASWLEIVLGCWRSQRCVFVSSNARPGMRYFVRSKDEDVRRNWKPGCKAVSTPQLLSHSFLLHFNFHPLLLHLTQDPLHFGREMAFEPLASWLWTWLLKEEEEHDVERDDHTQLATSNDDGALSLSSTTTSFRLMLTSLNLQPSRLFFEDL